MYIPRKQQTTIRVCTSFIILQNILHFLPNVHYQQLQF